MIDTKVNLKEEVLFVQKLLLDNLPKKTNLSKTPVCESTGVLSDIVNAPDAKVLACLGDMGVQAKKLVEYFNLNHPCIQPLLHLFTQGTVPKRVTEVFSIYDTMIEFDTPNILALINRAFNETSLAKSLDSFINHEFPVRAVADPGLREEIRKNGKLSKKAGSVGFTELEANQKNWSEYSSSMKYYVRLNEGFSVDVKHYKDVICKYMDLGMESQANVFLSRMNATSKMTDKYCGFQRIDVDHLVGSLGRVHGFFSNSTPLSFDINPEMVRFLLQHLCLSPRLLRDVMEWLDERWTVNEPITLLEALDYIGNYSNLKDLTGWFNRNNPLFYYRARVYMVSNPIVNKMLSCDTIGIIEQLDKFHDFGHLPLFDYFLLMVPSIAITDSFFNERNKSYFICDGNSLRDFGKHEDASVFLDFLMMKRRVVTPILIGQKDNQQYLIGYCV